MVEKFETFLRQGNMADNTISAYQYAVNDFYSRHKDLNKRNLLLYKTYLIETFKPKTVNLRIQALNKYLDFVNKTRLRLKSVKVQQRSYLENVISNADYIFLKNKLKKEENQEWYFVVRYLAATGARVSELIQIKVEHVFKGYFDLYSKGGKLRRLYIPKKLKIETESWLKEKGVVMIEQVRRTNYSAWNFATTKKLCNQIRTESESGISALFQTPFCEKFS